MNVGDLIREKMQNMQRWLEANGLQTTPRVTDLSKLQLVAIAQAIPPGAVSDRSFAELLTHPDAAALADSIRFVQGRPEMHDKFWRYLELFSELVV